MNSTQARHEVVRLLLRAASQFMGEPSPDDASAMVYLALALVHARNALSSEVIDTAFDMVKEVAREGKEQEAVSQK